MRLVHADRPQQRRKQPSVRNSSCEVLGCEAELTQTVDGDRQDLRVRWNTRFSHDIDIPLEVLAESPPLGTLVSKELGHGGPSNRLAEATTPLGEHPGQRGRHLRPERDRSTTLVLEAVQLTDDLFSALLDVQVQRLQGRSVILLKSVPASDTTPRALNVQAPSKLFGRKIPETGKLGEFLSGHEQLNFGDETGGTVSSAIYPDPREDPVPARTLQGLRNAQNP